MNDKLIDLRSIGENLPLPDLHPSELERMLYPAEPPPPYPTHLQRPSILVTQSPNASSSQVQSTYTRSRSPKGSSEFVFGIDAELEEILANDPGLMEIKGNSRSCFEHNTLDEDGPQRAGLWYSLPSENHIEQKKHDFVQNPNVVESVKSHAVSSR